MPTVYLVRHGRTSANKKGILAGRTKGVDLDSVGLNQALEVSYGLSSIKFNKVISSPMQRCKQTASIIVKNNKFHPKVSINESFNECNYGDWSNKKLSTLRRNTLWKQVQEKPSLVTFPNGESFIQILDRFKKAIFQEVSELKKDQNLLVVSHGDPIRIFIADSFGLHLDQFQKIIIDPCSISILTINGLDISINSVNNRLDKFESSKSSDLGGGKG